MSDKKNRIELPLEKSLKPFEQSFNRVKYFSQITENISTEIFPSSWEIKSKSGVSYMIKAPEEDKKEYVLDGYKHFVLRYLTRDCIESFALSLDNLFSDYFLMEKEYRLSRTFMMCSPQKIKNF